MAVNASVVEAPLAHCWLPDQFRTYRFNLIEYVAELGGQTEDFWAYKVKSEGTSEQNIAAILC